MPELDKGASAEALYAQLITYLRDRILDGTFPLGTRIPTEVELARVYQVSRGTVRQAMTVLVNEGLLERAQGRGTFVRSLPTAPSEVEAPTGKRIGLLVSHPGGELDLDILIGVESAAKARGYRVSFAYTEENREQQTQDIARLQADQVGGMVIFPLSDIEYDEAIWRLRAESIPFVLVDRYFPELDCDYVVSDNLGGGYRATEHLIILGHQRIAFAYSYIGTLTTTSVRDRWRGYRKALHEYGLPDDESLIFQVAHPAQSGAVDPYHDWLLPENRPDAIFAATDHLALWILQAAQRRGLRVPEDVALIGFDDLRFTAHLNPPLTTVAQPRTEVGLRAGNLLISRIEGLDDPPKHLELPTTLIIRESCGARRHVRAAMTPKSSP